MPLSSYTLLPPQSTIDILPLNMNFFPPPQKTKDKKKTVLKKLTQALFSFFLRSNGVRFSITNLTPTTARTMPTLFQDRAPISLYDAQWSGTSKAPISDSVISKLVTCMLHFRTVCGEFGVPHKNVRIVATEATREAQNSAQFRAQIESATGWTVELLSKEDEGRIGAEGVASSFSEVNGLVMDLGGGSTQISWMISKDGVTRVAEKPLSFPYGAAAVTKKLETAIDDKPRRALHAEMVENFSQAIVSLQVPDDLGDDASEEWVENVKHHHPAGLRSDKRYKLYLSGGGFRGFGYLLMANYEPQPYPIPIINGFTVSGKEFRRLALSDVSITEQGTSELGQIFGISSRRARQVPAVSLVVEALTSVLGGALSKVLFCQGGVREGAIYESLLTSIRAENPLVVATRPYALQSQPYLLELLNHACPRSTPYHIRSDLLPPLANLMYYHSNIPKEGQASVALYATTTGVLANTHGLSHGLRALLAIALCDRWGGDVPSSAALQRKGFVRLIGGENTWWARYVGHVAALIGEVYPSGRTRGDPVTEQIRFFAQDETKKKKKKNKKQNLSTSASAATLVAEDDPVDSDDDAVLSADGSQHGNTTIGHLWLKINVRPADPMTSTIMFEKAINALNKVGKRKRMEGGWRRKIAVDVFQEL